MLLAPEATPGERPHVAALEFDVQARVAGRGSTTRWWTCGGLPCWPSEPDWAQLDNGDKLGREGWQLRVAWDERRVGTQAPAVGDDFDLVVLAVGGGAVARSARS